MDQNPENDEVSLIDLLLVLATNWKLLVAAPLLVGLCTLAISFSLPQTYISQSILRLPTVNPNQQNSEALSITPTPAQAAAMMTSPIVLDPVIETLDLSQGKVIQDARTELADKIKAAVGKDTLLRLDVEGASPAEAQKTADAIIDSWLKSTTPGEQEQADLAARLANAQKSLEGVNRLLERLTSEGSTTLNQPLTRGEAGTSLVAMGELQNLYLGDVLAIPRAIKGLSRDVVLQPPTLPSKAIAPKKGLMAVVATLATGVALILFVFVRASWRKAGTDPEFARKQSELFASLKR